MTAPHTERKLSILENHDATQPYNRFWLIEQYLTCDGLRSRIASDKFATYEEADTYRRAYYQRVAAYEIPNA